MLTGNRCEGFEQNVNMTSSCLTRDDFLIRDVMFYLKKRNVMSQLKFAGQKNGVSVAHRKEQ